MKLSIQSVQSKLGKKSCSQMFDINSVSVWTMASGPITSWQIDGETGETEAGLIFLGSKITADGDCSHDMTNLNSILKSRD